MAIKSFSHKGLESLYFEDDHSGVNPEHKKKLCKIMDAIEASHHPADLKAIYQHRFREKKGSGQGVFSIDVNGNWRVTFEVLDDGAVFLDYCDYHGKIIRSKSK
jgi:Plasmid maintenance system killer protein